MKKIIFFMTVIGALLLMTSMGLNEPYKDKCNDGWKLVWEENFESEAIDWNVWSKTTRGTADWQNTQSQDERCYAFRDGNLVLRGIVNDDRQADTAAFLTGGLVTQGKKAFEPGRIEVRAKLGSARGAWPAIWLLPFDRNSGWPKGGEIDIMEHLNYDGFVYQTVHSHYTYTLGHKDEPKNYGTIDIDPDGFNVYGVDIHQDSVVFHVNGVRNCAYPRLAELPDSLAQFPYCQPMYLLIDMQLGGSWVGEVDPADLPVEMEIDWVRHYVKEPDAVCGDDACMARPAVSIVPKPSVMRENRSVVSLPSDRLAVYAGDKSLKQLVAVWADFLKKPYAPGVEKLSTGFTRIVSETVLPAVKATGNEAKADVRLYLDGSLAEEEYVMEVTQEGVTIKGGSSKGVWWGLQTLSQILIQSASSVSDGEPLRVPGLYIQDKPHFAYRGAHFDPCRHFFTVDEVKKFIDIMALHKLNTLHWHLTEDQGWRIEIRKYPLLTEVGAVRKETKVGHYNDAAAGYDGTPYGEGMYYSRKDIKEIVSYAAARQITVIPEIEMPGHAVAALTSYPWLGCVGKGYEVRTTWGISDDVFCVGKESTFEFLENVLDEVCELFPSEYIHVGGDECPTVRWKSCPDCQQRMKSEGLKNENQLLGYLMHRIEGYLNAKGRKIIGWDEILEGGVSPTATVMSWRGPQGGIEAAKHGNDVVMTPNNYFYFDYYQTADPEGNGEPLGIGGHVSLEKSYSFDPYDGLDENTKKHIKGVQANSWSEYFVDFDHYQHMDLPRFAALAEVAWSEERTCYEMFLARVTESLKQAYEYFGYIYAPYVFEGKE